MNKTKPASLLGIALAIALLIVSLGCDVKVSIEREDYTPHAAVTLGQISIDSTPAPMPIPSDGKCKNCKGVGKVGDGRTMLTCDVCKGTGRETKPGMATALGPANVDTSTDVSIDVSIESEPVDQPAESLPPPQAESQPMVEGTENDPESQVKPSLPFKPPSETSEASVVPPVPTIIMFTRDDCAPCRKWKKIEAEHFRKAGWTIEELDSDGWVPRFEVRDSKRRFSHVGYMTVDEFNAKYYEK